MASIPSSISPSQPATPVAQVPTLRFWDSASQGEVVVPASASTLSGFREWALSHDFPERGKITFVDGDLIVDMSPELLEKHSDIKTEIGRVLANLAREQKQGRLYIDGVLITNEEAGVSNEPDILFLAKETIQAGRAKLTTVVEDPESSKEVVGSVDWVLEIVSPSSIKKDKVLLRDAYYRAGIGEYWIVDVRGEAIEFDVLVPGEKEYVAAESKAGWQHSPTFEKEFRLVREKEDDGYWLYTLDMRETP